jgi:hypothetical protein
MCTFGGTEVQHKFYVDNRRLYERVNNDVTRRVELLTSISVPTVCQVIAVLLCVTCGCSDICDRLYCYVSRVGVLISVMDCTAVCHVWVF